MSEKPTQQGRSLISASQFIEGVWNFGESFQYCGFAEIAQVRIVGASEGRAPPH